MTREKAVGNLIHAIRWNDIPKKEVLEMAVEVLKQEPCEDAISREDALMALTGEWTDSTDELIHRFIRRIKTLPSVTPQPKTGHWINNQNGTFECGRCGCKHSKSRFCPDCGMKMVEPQESRDKDCDRMKGR